MKKRVVLVFVLGVGLVTLAAILLGALARSLWYPLRYEFWQCLWLGFVALIVVFLAGVFTRDPRK